MVNQFYFSMANDNDLNRSQTSRSFKDKWEKNANLAFSQTSDENSDIFEWIINRNGFSSVDEFSAFLKGKKRILDAGCGNGRVTSLLKKYADEDAKVVGIDLTAAHVASENLKYHKNVSVFEKDLLDDLTDLGTFDFIYSQEVLHHTADPRRSFNNLVQLLRPEGEISIYVYKIKAPLREYADDYVRNIISDMNYEESSRVLDEITEFGRIMAKKGITIEVPKVDILGIEAGEYDLQRFIYHFFFKCYWNDMFSKEENNVINYDWYHPQIASRHSLDEILGWYLENNLVVSQKNVDHYGITVRGRLI